MSVGFTHGDVFDYKNWDVSDTDPWFMHTPPDAIGHGVNCKGLMGSGIAVQFRERYPAMFQLYRRACDLGLLLPGQVLPWKPDPAALNVVFNIASQYLPGPNAKYDYLEMGLKYCHFYMRQNGLQHLALPQIGAGIGGLEWNRVVDIVDEIFGVGSVNATLVTWRQQ